MLATPGECDWTNHVRGLCSPFVKPLVFIYLLCPPFPQIVIIGAMVIVWRVRGKIIRSVLCNIVCNNCAQGDAHTYEQTNSSLDWVLSHWAHFTVLRFIFALCITVCCMHAWDCNMVRWTWWDWSLSLGLLLPSVLWRCRLGHLTRKTRPRYDL